MQYKLTQFVIVSLVLCTACKKTTPSPLSIEKALTGQWNVPEEVRQRRLDNGWDTFTYNSNNTSVVKYIVNFLDDSTIVERLFQPFGGFANVPVPQKIKILSSSQIVFDSRDTINVQFTTSTMQWESVNDINRITHKKYIRKFER